MDPSQQPDNQNQVPEAQQPQQPAPFGSAPTPVQPEVQPESAPEETQAQPVATPPADSIAPPPAGEKDFLVTLLLSIFVGSLGSIVCSYYFLFT